MPRRLLLLPLLFAPLALADGPRDNVPAKVRPMPPAGIHVPDEKRRELLDKLAPLTREVAELPAALKGKPALLELLPDVEVFEKAVRWALAYGEVYAARELDDAANLIEEGLRRAKQLRAGKPGWPAATGLVVRGFRSRIDGSVQPYGLVVPSTYRPGFAHRHRLDVWLHGRMEFLSELHFIAWRQRTAGEFTPADAFVLHPYGRYCNAFKLAGEVDVFEALAHARRHYPIDGRRLVVRGFSMGGAGCWHLAAHYPGVWAAAAPGAGFSETPLFLKHFQKETLDPAWYEKKLWQLYDCPGWVGNFHNLPVVAYSGEDDVQKQAADVMADAFRAEGVELVHLIGPKTGHSYHPRTREELNRRIDRLAERGRPRAPGEVRFVTYTLRYDRSHWLRVDELGEHWKQARVDARIGQDGKGGRPVLRVDVNNVRAFTVSFEPGDAPWGWAKPAVSLGGAEVEGLPPARSDGSWEASFVQTPEGWKLGRPHPQRLRKKHGLQGPIDDAFMGPFLMVRPTGEPWHEKTGRWVKGEMAHAIDQWRKVFRGDAPVKDDTAVTDADVARSNLILWGDPSSNAVLKKVIGRLPLKWGKGEVALGPVSGDASRLVPVLIYPNPLNPERYVVVNSGPTVREYDHLNNARQVPKLPDWAVLHLDTPPSSRWPARVLVAGFFDEGWKLRQEP